MRIPFVQSKGKQTVYEYTYTQPLRKYAVEFIDGETRSYIANTHELDEGFLILKEGPNGFVWRPEWRIARPKDDWDVVKRLSCVRDVSDTQIGHDEYVVVYDVEQGTKWGFSDTKGIDSVDHTRVIE